MLIFSAFSLSPFLFLFLLSCSGSWPLLRSLCFQSEKLSDHPCIPYPPFFFADVFLLKILAFLTMGAPKQKWTAEEEAAVKARVRKHGAGKWQTILRDPDFSDVLRSCSNVDLKVRNFREETPGLFRGRGEHFKMGKLKKSICPSHITLNIGKDAPIPECPIPGERWKEIRHDNTITWLAFWNDPINLKEFKCVFLAASSTLKGQSDKEKYEKQEC